MAKQETQNKIENTVLIKGQGRSGSNLKYYYWATQLSAVVEWINNNQETGWVQTEERSAQGIHLSVLPFLNKKLWNKLKIINEWTRQEWVMVSKRLGEHSFCQEPCQLLAI